MQDKRVQLPSEMEPDTPLWRFALVFWKYPGIESTCLALQGKGWNVTQILGACWLTITGHKYSGYESDTVTEWRSHVTEPLRSARKFMPRHNPVTESLRASIATNELEAERIELALTYQSLANTQSESAGAYETEHLARTNLEAAAPETVMDMETGQLLDALTRSLMAFSAGAQGE
ncbi:TIGR02444 family protein [uncultured Marinobacter sp.]|uniref:TIGR02444 family protein n=1 Tax=uncultured Marinobacter sp. TaxID=187379 RepID=UPI00263204C8|nr:TIGR02444 family protein [uncultured Marinobacter sp.]